MELEDEPSASMTTTTHPTYMFAASVARLLVSIARVLELLATTKVLADQSIRPTTHVGGAVFGDY